MKESETETIAVEIALENNEQYLGFDKAMADFINRSRDGKRIMNYIYDDYETMIGKFLEGPGKYMDFFVTEKDPGIVLYNTPTTEFSVSTREASTER